MRKKRDTGSVVTMIFFHILFSIPTIWLLIQAMTYADYKQEIVLIVLSALGMYSLGITKGIKSRDRSVIRLAKEADELEATIFKLKEQKENNKK